MAAVIIPSPVSELRSFVKSQSGQDVLRCYQCGKCTAGCPVAYAMDLGPRQIMRAIQLGLKQEVLQSSTIWLCVFCQTCSVRCPQEIDIARVMESLRILAIAEKGRPAEKDIELFHRLFIAIVERRGRIHELELGARYNLQGWHPLANIGLLPSMLAKGKMPILAPKVEASAEIKKLFAAARAVEAKLEGRQR
jgi:heterodisulfide reductase subunit C